MFGGGIAREAWLLTRSSHGKGKIVAGVGTTPAIRENLSDTENQGDNRSHQCMSSGGTNPGQCHDLISPFYYISFPPLDSILILSFQPLTQLWSCFYCVVGSVSQAIFVLLLFHSPFDQYLMGIFLKY